VSTISQPKTKKKTKKNWKKLGKKLNKKARELFVVLWSSARRVKDGEYAGDTEQLIRKIRKIRKKRKIGAVHGAASLSS